MIIDFSIWSKANFFILLEDTLKALQNSPDHTLVINLENCKELDSGLLLRMLRATIGSLYRALTLDKKLGFDIKKIKISKLEIRGCSISVLQQLHRSFYRKHFPTITELELLIAKPTPKMPDFEVDKFLLSHLEDIIIHVQGLEESALAAHDRFVTDLSNDIAESITVHYNRPFLLEENEDEEETADVTKERKQQASVTQQQNSLIKNLLVKFFQLSDLATCSTVQQLLPNDYLYFESTMGKVFFHWGRNEVPQAITALRELLTKIKIPDAPGEPAFLVRMKLFVNAKEHNVPDAHTIQSAKAFIEDFLKFLQYQTPQIIAAWQLLLKREYEACCIPFSHDVFYLREDALNQSRFRELPFVQKLITQKVITPITFQPIVTIFSALKAKNINIEETGKLVHELDQIAGSEITQLILSTYDSKKNEVTYFPIIVNYCLQLASLMPKGAVTQGSNEFLQFIAILNSKVVNESSWPEIRTQFEELLTLASLKRYPERPLEELEQEFTQTSNVVEVALPKEFARQVFADCRVIKQHGDELIKLTDTEIQTKLKEVKTQLNEPNKLLLLAIIREQIRRIYKLNPYNVQIINVLALVNYRSIMLAGQMLPPDGLQLLKGVAAQIKTGEGKSMVDAMLGAYLGITEGYADLVTTAYDLGIRDVKKYQRFYQSLGLSAHCLPEKQRSPEDYAHPILYGTLSCYQFDYLFQNLGTPKRKNRPFKVIVVDEADNMFLDTQGTPAYIAAPNPKYPAKLYELMWAYATCIESLPFTTSALQTYLKEATGNDYPKAAVKRWIGALTRALHYEEDVNYAIRGNKVVIVDKDHTGALKVGQRWTDGLHAFIEVENAIPVTPEDLTTAQVTNLEYFNLYDQVIALTGTLGSREELWQSYHINTYDSPTHRPSKGKELDHIVAPDNESKLRAIVLEVKKSVAAGRPVLVFASTIENSKTYYNLLKNEVATVQMYNAIQQADAETVLALAGNPGVVTIATNTAGRGADITETPIAQANGCLDVVGTFPFMNRRVEKQGFGRTARQGRGGTYRYIVSVQDLLECPYMRPQDLKPGGNHIQVWRTKRDNYNVGISQYREKEKAFFHIQFLVQKFYFLLPNYLKDMLKTDWAEQYNELVQFTRTVIAHRGVDPANLPAVLRYAANIITWLWSDSRVVAFSKVATGLNGKSPLHLAVEAGDMDLVRFTIQCAPHLLIAKDNAGNTPGMYAPNMAIANLLAEELRKFQEAREKPVETLLGRMGFFASATNEKLVEMFADSFDDEDFDEDNEQEFEDDDEDQDENEQGSEEEGEEVEGNKKMQIP